MHNHAHWLCFKIGPVKNMKKMTFAWELSFPQKGYLKRMFCTTDLINFYWIILIFLSSLAECGFYFLVL